MAIAKISSSLLILIMLIFPPSSWYNSPEVKTVSLLRRF